MTRDAWIKKNAALGVGAMVKICRGVIVALVVYVVVLIVMAILMANYMV